MLQVVIVYKHDDSDINLLDNYIEVKHFERQKKQALTTIFYTV